MTIRQLALVQQLLARHQGVSAERAGDLAQAGELLAEIGLARLREAGAPAVNLWEQTRRALATLLAGFDGPGASDVAPGERVLAGRALGLLGDPRIPLRDDEWRASLAALSTAFTASGEHYWRYVPAGRYWVGGWAEHDPYAGPLQRDQWVDLVPVAAFWLARLPVTVGQFAQFVADGYRDDANWTPHGLRWRDEQAASKSWGGPQYRGANQPVVYASWYEAAAYCRWLSARLDTALPAGYTLRLPSEAEWETAASYDGTERRRPHPWGGAGLTAGRAVTNAWQLSAPAPVGLCPAGMAACGALDLVGEVCEWSSSAEETYPKQANRVVEDYPVGPVPVPVRGMSWIESSHRPSSGSRTASSPYVCTAFNGLRLALAPQHVEASS